MADGLLLTSPCLLCIFIFAFTSHSHGRSPPNLLSTFNVEEHSFSSGATNRHLTFFWEAGSRRGKDLTTNNRPTMMRAVSITTIMTNLSIYFPCAATRLNPKSKPPNARSSVFRCSVFRTQGDGMATCTWGKYSYVHVHYARYMYCTVLYVYDTVGRPS